MLLRILKSYLVILTMLFGVFIPGVAQAADDMFTIVVLPDTQAYTFDPLKLNRLTTQIDWILQNRITKNIAFVIQVGDMTEFNIDSEWERFSTQIRRLDGLVPYAVVAGNHDVAFDYTTFQANYSNLDRYFSTESVQTTNSSYRDSLDGGVENSYYEFSAAGKNYGVITLEWAPGDKAINWANKVVSDNPNRIFIFATHAYMYHDNNTSSRYPLDNPVLANTRYGQIPNTTYLWAPPRGSGEEIWQKLISKHKNIMMVVSGHTLGSGTARRLDKGVYGNNVYQMLANYQMWWDGSFRIIEMAPKVKKFFVSTYSAFNGTHRSDGYNQFSYGDVNSFSSDKQGDFNFDSLVNIVDFNILISNYGNPYNLFDFNKIVTYFGVN